MGKLCFSKLTKFFAFALLSAATAIAAVAVLSSSASARTPGGGGDVTEKSWDTDNLKYGGYSARSFAIPHMSDSDRGSSDACAGGGVADAFFQNNSARNDMPELVVSSDGGSVVLGSGHATCSDFVAEQVSAKDGALSNGGYYLDRDGILRNGLAFHHYPRGYSTGRWISGDTRGAHLSAGKFVVPASSAAVVDADYKNRVDYTDSGGNKILRGPAGVAYLVPSPLILNASQNGNTISWVPDFSSAPGVRASNALVLSENRSRRLCPAGLHPRGEDAARRIGTGTGRTLSSLTLFDETQTADQHWCRSDARHAIKYELEVIQGKTCGTGGNAKSCPSGVGDITDGEIATAYGRVNCYYTTLGDINTAQENSCDYMFPIPQCTKNAAKQRFTAEELGSYTGRVFPFNTDGSTSCTAPQCTHNGTKRDMTDAEIAEYRKDNASFTPAADGSTPCSANPAGPPQQAGFTADPCVTADLDIYENRTVGSAAEPGVTASDRTLVVAAGRTAWDLDITSPHHNTASPPRNVASTPADATGCADGSESRADHSSDAGSAVRKNTAAGVDLTLPASSVASESTHPPHSKGFASAGTDYSGAVKNIAHRYASNVAENTCAAAREFAELVLEILKGRRLVFQSYIDGYEDTIDTAITGYSSYSTTIQSGSENSANAYNNLSLEEMRQNALERQREKYVKDRQAYLTALKAALENAETDYQRATNSTKLVLGSVNSNGCINSYKNAITALKDLAAAAETAFPSTDVRRSVALTKKEYRVTGTQTATTLTHGTKDFMRLYNALSLKSYTDKVPNYTVTSSPESDARPADNNLTWNWKAGEGWSLPTTTYSCAYLWTSGYYQETYLGVIQCVKRRQAERPINKSCPTGYSIKPVLLGERCSRQNKDGKEERTSVAYSCPSGWTQSTKNIFTLICTKSVVDSTRTAQSRNLYKRTKEYSNVVSGTVTGTLSGTTGKKADFSRTYTGSRICEYATVNFTSSHTSALRPLATVNNPQCGIIAHNAATGTSLAAARATVIGTAHQITLPSTSQMTTARPSALAAVTESSLLGKLHPSHSSRTNLKAATTAARNTAAANLGTLTQNGGGTTVVPSGFAAALNYTAVGPSAYAARFAPPASTAQRTAIATAATNYINEYAKAYQTAYNQAAGDMGTTATTTTWNNFDWRYQTSTLAWSNYQEDPATTYSGWAPRAGEAETDRDGTGCDLIAVAADGTVSVEATRLDYETSSYGKGSVYGVRTDAQRTCKIRRTRTPELLLMYAPSAISGTDTSKTADTRLDADSAASNAEFYYVDYQPTPAAERFKLYDEAEVFAVKASLEDSPPVFCAANIPSSIYVSHTAGAMSDISAAISAGRLYRTSTTVLRPTAYSATPPADHCFRSSFASASPVKVAVFDDTAHTAMNLVYLEKDPADTSGMAILASGGQLTALPAEPYPGDAAQSSQQPSQRLRLN